MDYTSLGREQLIDACKNRDLTIEILKAENEMLLVQAKVYRKAVVRAEVAANHADPRFVARTYEQVRDA